MAPRSVVASRTSPSTIVTRLGSGFFSRRARRKYRVSLTSSCRRRKGIVFRANWPFHDQAVRNASRGIAAQLHGLLPIQVVDRLEGGEICHRSIMSILVRRRTR
jgi:hypothetical protein